MHYSNLISEAVLLSGAWFIPGEAIQDIISDVIRTYITL
ncbi:hypothetical protein APHNP_0455 [Anaplasma phagocytophilum str. ApNP]|uniref:Uncharacterized protein n=1 Tax=Anaplasma phagocytophilum str. ApNP TaxID=1359153 RepID=A0A0F3NI77_ANAPH|nr:hypothetical protein APHNP_0455 [Anaplasma phagocytophilum str. ApNP]